MLHRILIADDHPLFRKAMRAIIAKTLGKAELVEVGSIAGLQETLDKGMRPTLILLDLKMPGAHGLSGLIYLRGKFPNTPIAIVSATDDMDTIHNAFKYGANGYIPKSTNPEELEEAINTLNQKGKWAPKNFQPDNPIAISTDSIEHRISLLTPQQFRVLNLLSEGMLNKQIGFELNVSEATVKAHVTAILRKLGVSSRMQALIKLKELNQTTETL